MVEPANTDLSIGKQRRLLSISRSSFYYRPKGETAMNLMLMRQIDEQFLETPFFGVRQMTWHLRKFEGTVAPVGPRKSRERPSGEREAYPP
ncbi:IS3 family transposase, partial [Epibacterium sp. SM1969]|nr:IS3 family transposase [Tritonibacter aquimaris]